MSAQVVEVTKWICDHARGGVLLVRAGTSMPPIGDPWPREALVEINAHELHSLIAFLRDEMPAVLTGIGFRRDPEDIKLLHRLVDVIQRERKAS